MKSKKSIVMIIGMLLVVLLLGAGLPLYITRSHKSAKATQEVGLGQYSEYELFQNTPVMTRKDIAYSKARDVGGGDYMITATNTALSDYKDYLSVLEKNGYEKLLDNGENGLDESVYTAHYQKNGLLLIVSHIVKLEKTTITITEKTQLSDHLFYDEAYIQEHKPGAKTSFHILEMKDLGNSFLFQLKNGHFILYDGGQNQEASYLIEYLESLTPTGEKPIIDAWIISHAHLDHMGVLREIANEPSYAERIYVESVYFDDPSGEMVEVAEVYDDVRALIVYCTTVSQIFKSTDGNGPKLYHPRLGERYYFSDFTIDILYTAELLEPEKWDTWNSSSTVMMFTIEGQKIMLTGDSDWCTQLIYTDMYDKEYFDLDVYQVPHHGINVYKQITSRFKAIRTAFYPTRAIGTVNSENSFIGRKMMNEHLVSVALESMSWAEGTKILTFPYEVGSAKTLPKKFVTEE